MRLSTLITLLPLASAMPRITNDKVIRDEAHLAKLKESHSQTLKALNQRSVTPIAGSSTDLEKRSPVIGLAGLILVPVAKMQAKTVSKIAEKILKTVGGDDQDMIWHSHDHCRTYFSTKGGANCETRTYNRGSKDRTATHQDDSCTWHDPDNNDPPVVYYEGDEGIGDYSIQYTATDSFAWDGVPDTKTCNTEGLCHPQYVFYREDYNIVLNTWQSEGRVSACQYSGGEDCLGLCSFGVKNQFTSGGNVWGGDCAIPCEGDDKLPDE